jgi:hypothetical protein
MVGVFKSEPLDEVANDNSDDGDGNGDGGDVDGGGGGGGGEGERGEDLYTANSKKVSVPPMRVTERRTE